MTQQDTQPPAETLAIIEMLQAAEVQEGVTVFDHSAEEIGIAVMENHHAILAALTRRAGGDAIGQSDGDPDGWLAVKVNGEGGIVMPYGPLHAGPDRPNDSRYRWAPFYIGDTK